MPIDGNAISGPITKLDTDAVLKKKDEDGDITNQTENVAKITPIKEDDIQIEINEEENSIMKDSEAQL